MTRHAVEDPALSHTRPGWSLLPRPHNYYRWGIPAVIALALAQFAVGGYVLWMIAPNVPALVLGRTEPLGYVEAVFLFTAIKAMLLLWRYP